MQNALLYRSQEIHSLTCSIRQGLAEQQYRTL